jgi:hypothetical protein
LYFFSRGKHRRCLRDRRRSRCAKRFRSPASQWRLLPNAWHMPFCCRPIVQNRSSNGRRRQPAFGEPREDCRSPRHALTRRRVSSLRLELPSSYPPPRKFSSLAGITARLLESPLHRALLTARENGPLCAPVNKGGSRHGMPAHSASGDDSGGIDGPRHARSLRVGCGVVNPATARDCPGWAAASCVSLANLQRVRSPAHRE